MRMPGRDTSNRPARTCTCATQLTCKCEDHLARTCGMYVFWAYVFGSACHSYRCTNGTVSTYPNAACMNIWLEIKSLAQPMVFPVPCHP